MTALDGRLRLLQGQAREWAAQIRPHGAAVDRDPDHIAAIAGLPALARVATLQIPPEYNPAPLVIGGEKFHLMSALERVVFFEEWAWGDLGIMLAAPGAPMAGVAVDALGSPAQKEAFYGRLLDRPTWVCFALTEPERGSDATHLETRLERTADDGPMLLSGGKHLVGNGVRADLGLVFARTGPGPLGVAAVLVDMAAPGVTTTPMATLGVRAAQLGAIRLDRVEIAPEQVLGTHLRPTRRGMWAWLRTFNLLRPTVATMGVGVARAAHDYVTEHRGVLRADERWRLDRMADRIEAVRRLARDAAAEVDRDPGDGSLASAAKAAAARLAEQVTVAALDFFGPGARLDHPRLDKLARDARAIEFMEGAGNVQRLTVFGGVVRGSLVRPRFGEHEHCEQGEHRENREYGEQAEHRKQGRPGSAPEPTTILEGVA
jgi:alkylation response protein AidB-like acyl-CoA dehydrogenase